MKKGIWFWNRIKSHLSWKSLLFVLKHGSSLRLKLLIAYARKSSMMKQPSSNIISTNWSLSPCWFFHYRRFWPYARYALVPWRSFLELPLNLVFDWSMRWGIATFDPPWLGGRLCHGGKGRLTLRMGNILFSWEALQELSRHYVTQKWVPSFLWLRMQDYLHSSFNWDMVSFCTVFLQWSAAKFHLFHQIQIFKNSAKP